MLIDRLCKSGGCAEAREIFNSMIQSGENPNVTTFGSLLYGYATKGNLVEMKKLIDLMVQNSIQPNHHIFNIQIYACYKCGRLDEALLTFNKIR
jgi:leucine-rich PPR motif-containing protein